MGREVDQKRPQSHINLRAKIKPLRTRLTLEIHSSFFVPASIGRREGHLAYHSSNRQWNPQRIQSHANSEDLAGRNFGRECDKPQIS
eukprot:scaffold1954_cov268-Pinguiococcus_pyrenoidosus.AAC.253